MQAGQTTKIGSEFRVNTFTANDQSEARMAELSDGSFVVVWHSDGQDGGGYGVYGQRYNSMGVAQGAEFRINQTTTVNHQLNPIITGLADGGFMVAWQSYPPQDEGIYAQRFNSAGVAQGADFLVNTTQAGQQANASLVTLTNGDVVATWMSQFQDGSGWGIYGQRYNNAGVVQGNEFAINTTTIGDQYIHTSTSLADGGFVVTWMSNKGITNTALTPNPQLTGQENSWEIHGQRYDGAGIAQGTEFRVNTVTENHQAWSSVAGLSNGDFVVTWNSTNQDGSSEGVYGQRYNNMGVAQGAEFRINTTTANAQQFPSVTGLNNGDFVATWMSQGQDGSGWGVIPLERKVRCKPIIGVYYENR